MSVAVLDSPQVSPIPSSNVQSLENGPVKEYSVHPYTSHGLDMIDARIKELAEGKVQTQLTLNRPEVKGILFWSFKMKEANAQSLRDALGKDVSAAMGLAEANINSGCKARLVETKPAGRHTERIYVTNESLPLI